MAFGEVVHYVTHSAGWPEPVRGIASLLSPFHCPDRLLLSNENIASASSSMISEPLTSHETPASESYTARDFQILIHSTAAGLSALAELPHCGGERCTVPLWSQLLHALANTLSPDALILEDAPFIMPRAQIVSRQPSNLIDGHATLLVAHAIFAAPRTRTDISRTSSQYEEDQDESMCSTDQDESMCSTDQDESMCSTDSDSCDGSVDSLDLPLQAHMLRGRGRRLCAVLPVLLVADSCNIVPLLCSTLYQRHVWGIRQPVVGLCCSSTGTIATAIFGWLDSDQSEEGHMPTAHLALAADVRSDPLMGVFDFTDTSSAISLAQFILGLRAHFEDIKGATSIEAVDSLAPLHWRSDLPDFETQFWGQSDERVASWTHQVHVQSSSGEASSSSAPRTPSPLLDTARVSYETTSSPSLPAIVGDEQVHGANIRLQDSRTTNAKGRARGSKPSSLKDSLKTQRTSPSPQPPQPLSEARSSTSSRASSPYPSSQFDVLSDYSPKDHVSISNWLFERHAYTIGRIKFKIRPGERKFIKNEAEINVMIKLYDRMTAFTWSDEIKTILSSAEVDSSLLDIRSKLCDTNGGPNCQSSETDNPSLEDVKFISCRLSALLHAVKGARSRDDVANLHSANEAGRRHEWDSLLLNFFQPVANQWDVLLERQLNLARNLAVDDPSFATNAVKVAQEYHKLCIEQHWSFPLAAGTSFGFRQAAVARDQAAHFADNISTRCVDQSIADKIKTHSSKDPVTGICDAILVTPYSGGATAMLQGISDIKEQQNPLKSFMLVQDPKPEKLDTSQKESSHQIEKTVGPSRKTTSKKSLQVPSSSRISNSRKADRNHSEPTRGTDLLLPILLAEYKKRDASAISTSMNRMKIYQVSAVTFLSALGITDQPVFGLVVNGTLGAVTMAWKTKNQIYVMERNVRHYDITDPLQALQFVSILPRLARHGKDLRRLIKGQPPISDVKPWSKLHQRQKMK